MQALLTRPTAARFARTAGVRTSARVPLRVVCFQGDEAERNKARTEPPRVSGSRIGTQPTPEQWNSLYPTDRPVQSHPINDYDTGYDANELGRKLQSQWERLSDKRTAVVLTLGGVLALWISSSLLSNLERIPLIGNTFTFVGLCYSSVFLWKYVVFRSGRDQLISDVKDLYAQVSSAIEGRDAPDTAFTSSSGNTTPTWTPPEPASPISQDVKNAIKDNTDSVKDASSRTKTSQPPSQASLGYQSRKRETEESGFKRPPGQDMLGGSFSPPGVQGYMNEDSE